LLIKLISFISQFNLNINFINLKQQKNMIKKIVIKGAKEHNLKNISVEIPKDQFVVITGLSGSGKSSLAFDTVYAEGQRRYVESLSAYARQFLDKMKKPNVDLIEGLSPAIAIEQKNTSKNPRSTVATVTEIYDYMRVLYARAGVPYSPFTGKPITSQTITQIVDLIKKLPKKSTIYVYAPVVRGRKGEYKKDILSYKRRGFRKIKIDDVLYEIDKAPDLDKKIKHDISVLVDRIVLNSNLGNRLAESIETAVNLSNGLVFVEYENETLPQKFRKIEKLIYSTKFACPESGFTIEEIEPRLFSFNSPYGACAECEGIGIKLNVDPNLVVPDERKSIGDGAIEPWAKSTTLYYAQTLASIAKHYGFSLDEKWKKLPKKIKDVILFGSDEEEIKFNYDDGYEKYSHKKTFEGVVNNLERRFLESDSEWKREAISEYQSDSACEGCNGKRLKEEALCVKINDQNISDVTKKSILDAARWFKDLEQNLDKRQFKIAEHILKEINERLNFLLNVGLDYLTLSRESGTLSGGEAQRIRLASQIGSGLTGVLYVLDEPSIGLHQKDNVKLIDALKRLRDLGNTVIVVEHDTETMESADHIIDLGPEAGTNGGQIIAQGTYKEILKNKNSITGQYLSHKKYIAVPRIRRLAKNGRFLEINGASGNNLNNVNLKIPIGSFTCVTGVSGSGKSTLILQTLYHALNLTLNNKARKVPKAFKGYKGVELIDKIIDIDQSPIGRTPRSNPATYTGAFGPIRDWFTALPESKTRGYKPGRFSFNVKGGRCEACEGDGVITYEMHFLPDVYIQCDECKGTRYNRETLEIKFKDKSIADVLDMSVDEGCEYFENISNIKTKLLTLKKVGLGYIKIGQQATTLSGGEAQRIKLAKELSKRSTGRTMYILDEPTTGLHQHDIKKLLEILHTFVALGNTVIVIEHNLDVIKTADYIVDMGPEGGVKGGNIIAEGKPEEIVNIKGSYTGQYLKPMLEERFKK
jgi:excinuclease ABC subunit A